MKPPSVSPQKLRSALFLTALSLAVLCAFASYFSRFRNRNAVLLAMGACAACSLLRGVHGNRRRELLDKYLTYHGTPMYQSRHMIGTMRAAVAWGLFDSAWLALDFTACLTLGIPGAFGIIFQAVFLFGFGASHDLRPDMWDSVEKAQAMDMLESMLYAQACAAMAIAAFILG